MNVALIHTQLKESVGKSRRDAMFIEKLEPIDLGDRLYGRTIVGCAPKGATTNCAYPSIDISPLRGFSEGLLN